MSFRTALSGINAATADLNVTSHNIANVNTPGFKGSRTDFAEVFSVSPFGLSRNATGSGVRVASVSQQFIQGNIEFTNNNLDLAISGQGFFTVSDKGMLAYTRAGNFSPDRNGFVMNPAGQRLQVFPPIPGTSSFDTGRMVDLRLSIAESAPTATTTIGVGANLPAKAEPPVVAPFDQNDPKSYNHTTSLTIYDSLGVAHVATMYFVKTANDNEWQMYTSIDGNPVGGAETLQYSSTGALITPASGSITLPPHTPGTGAADITLTLEIGDSTQYGERFAVNELRQNGAASGRLTGIEVSAEGVVTARYTNGQSIPLGQVALTSFTNPQGLQKLGDNAWGETFASGQPIRGIAGTSSFGLIESGALEGSNVDLTEQLVNMITAQRNFQANAQTITVNDQVTQTVLNIR